MSNDKNETFLKVRKIIADVLNMDEESIKMESKIIDDLGAESLDIITLLMEFEDEFSSQIPDEDAEKMVTVSDTVDYIIEKTSKK